MKKRVALFLLCTLFVLFTSCGIPNIFSFTWSDYTLNKNIDSSYDQSCQITVKTEPNSSADPPINFTYKDGFPRIALFYQIIPVTTPSVESYFTYSRTNFNNKYCDPAEGVPFDSAVKGQPYDYLTSTTSNNGNSGAFNYGVFQFRRTVSTTEEDVTVNNDALIYLDLEFSDENDDWKMGFELSDNGELIMYDLNSTESNGGTPKEIHLLRCNGTDFTSLYEPQNGKYGSSAIGVEVPRDLISKLGLSLVEYRLDIYAVVQSQFREYSNTCNTTLNKIAEFHLDQSLFPLTDE